MTNRLTQIADALEAVEKARTQCPFHNRYVGRDVHGADDPCKKCGKRKTGDGGRCVIERAEHQSILAIEEALA